MPRRRCARCGREVAHTRNGVPYGHDRPGGDRCRDPEVAARPAPLKVESVEEIGRVHAAALTLVAFDVPAVESPRSDLNYRLPLARRYGRLP